MYNKPIFATAHEVRRAFLSRGYQVKIDRGGNVFFREDKPKLPWRAGRNVREYLWMNGEVIIFARDE